MQFRTTMDTLGELGFDRPYLKVLNKCDGLDDLAPFSDFVCISAKYGQGLNELENKIAQKFETMFTVCKLSVPYSEISAFSRYGELISEKTRKYDEGGLKIECVVENIHLPKLKKYIVKD